MRWLVLSLLTVFCLVAIPTTLTVAQDPLSEACDRLDGRGGDSTTCIARDNTDVNGNPINSTLNNVIQLIIIAVGFAAVLTIIIAGFRYITSSGNPETTNAAKNAIMFAVIGLVVALVAQIIVSFVLRSL